jgi:hypothetical protein
LSEAGGFFFEIGSAELQPAFEQAIKDRVVPRLLEIARDYPDVNVIEVVGHTDEQRIKARASNLDDGLIVALRGGQVSSLQPADNAGLGLARAVSVVGKLLKDERLVPFSRILPFSGAQLIQTDQTLAHGAPGDVRQRRRIEIRVRKYEPVAPGDQTVLVAPSPAVPSSLKPKLRRTKRPVLKPRSNGGEPRNENTQVDEPAQPRQLHE